MLPFTAWEIFWTLILFSWVIIVVRAITPAFYRWAKRRGMEENKVVYYNRKIIHMLAGGLVALIVPYVFKTPLLPFILATLLAVLTYVPHRVGKLMYWFQVKDNMYEVNFCLMWGMIIALSWIIFGMDQKAYWYGVIPVVFMSFGDGVTGIVRNLMYGKRTKSWYGNLAMLLVTVPIGALAMGLPGAIAGLLSSIVEHFEISGIIDDNITVPLVGFLTLTCLNYLLL
ncbi:MAG: dolichol kinase [Thermoprotei archaeon]|nr:MAG: dolichol kinase [Thermoprotei archaeon]